MAAAAAPKTAGTVTQKSWAVALLHGLGAPLTKANIQAIVGWENAEGGNWGNSATFNPLNTTQVPASGSYGNTGTQGNIKAYSSWKQGLDATIATLRNGQYGSILSALKAGNNPNAVAGAIGSSPWGTNGGLVSQTISGATITGNVGAGGSVLSTVEQAGLVTAGLIAAGPVSLPLAVAGVATGAAGTVASGAGTVASGVAAALTAPVSVAEALGKIASFLTSGANWLRLGEILLGAFLLLLGLRALTGGDGNPVSAASSVARRVR